MPTRKPREPRTVEQNISFASAQIIGNIQRVPKLRVPTPKEAAAQLLAQAIKNVQMRQQKKSFWTAVEGIYFNRETGREYVPHHEAEREFVYGDTPTNGAVFGSEGSGKSCAGIVKVLEKVRRKMSGAISSPDLPHLKKSLWPEFQRWNVWQEVIEEHQYMQQFGWSMREPTLIAYKNGATLLCGGMDNPMAWEGPNLNFAYIDEARRLKDATALKTLKGRIRIAGPNGEQPQFFVTTTKPRNTDHWLYEYFGEIIKDDDGNIDDPQLSFKKDSRVVNLLLRENLINLSEGFLEQRSQGLSPEEIRLLVDNEWVELDEQEAFLPSIALFDSCKEDLPPLDSYTPLVLSLDAAEVNDTFFATACSWHPTRGREVTALRYSRCWEPKGQLLDFDSIEKEIGDFIDNHRVVLLTYDAALIRHMCGRLSKKVWAREFSQQRDRLIADKGLLDSIMQRTVVHDGSHLTLRKHLMNADKKTDADGRKCRIVKRSANLKIDGAVSLSMGREWAASTKINLGLA